MSGFFTLGLWYGIGLTIYVFLRILYMPKQVIFLAAGFLLLGILPLPYGYYTLLRLIACAVFAWAAYVTFENDEALLPWIFIVLALLFNPVIKVYLSKEIWAVIDGCSAIFLLIVSPKLQQA